LYRLEVTNFDLQGIVCEERPKVFKIPNWNLKESSESV
jgi:hypothetical protein